MWKFAWILLLTLPSSAETFARFVAWVRDNPPPPVSPVTPGALEDYLLEGLMYAITGPMSGAELRAAPATARATQAGPAQVAGKGGERR